eukprot:Skav200626  [mRNA]  locus=scaffold2029:170025:171473:+ [translate_table: standard]
MAPGEYYRILGLEECATDIDIKKAYRKEALKWHPDKNPDNKEESEKHFKALAEAYEILSSPDKRAAYDCGGKDAVRQSGGYSHTDFGDMASALRKFEEAVKESRGWLMEELYGERPRKMVGCAGLMRKEVRLSMSSRNQAVETLKQAEALEQAVRFIEGEDEDPAKNKKQKKKKVKPQRFGPKGAHLEEVEEPCSKETFAEEDMINVGPPKEMNDMTLKEDEPQKKQQKGRRKKTAKSQELIHVGGKNVVPDVKTKTPAAEAIEAPPAGEAEVKTAAEVPAAQAKTERPAAEAQRESAQGSFEVAQSRIHQLESDKKNLMAEVDAELPRSRLEKEEADKELHEAATRRVEVKEFRPSLEAQVATNDQKGGHEELQKQETVKPKQSAPAVPFQMLPSVSTWMVPCKPCAAQDLQDEREEKQMSRGFAMEEAHAEDLGVLRMMRSQRKEKPKQAYEKTRQDDNEEPLWQWLKAVLPCCCGPRHR